MQNLSSYLKHGFAWSYLFCSIVRFCARLTRVKLMSCWIQKLRCCMYVVRCWTRVYLYMSWFISCPAGLYLDLGWNDNWLIKKLSCILMGWLYANGPNANWPTSLLPHNCPCQHPYGSHAITTFHVIAMSAKTSIYTSSLLSTSLPSQQPRHPTCHQYMMWQLNLWWNLYYLWRLFLS